MTDPDPRFLILRPLRHSPFRPAPPVFVLNLRGSSTCSVETGGDKVEVPRTATLNPESESVSLGGKPSPVLFCSI